MLARNAAAPQPQPCDSNSWGRSCQEETRWLLLAAALSSVEGAPARRRVRPRPARQRTRRGMSRRRIRARPSRQTRSSNSRHSGCGDRPAFRRRSRARLTARSSPSARAVSHGALGWPRSEGSAESRDREVRRVGDQPIPHQQPLRESVPRRARRTRSWRRSALLLSDLSPMPALRPPNRGSRGPETAKTPSAVAQQTKAPSRESLGRPRPFRDGDAGGWVSRLARYPSRWPRIARHLTPA